MDIKTPNEPVNVPPEILAEITRLYEAGLYVQAGAKADAFPPVARWSGTAAQLIGGRLANHLYAPRLSRWLHGRAWRGNRTSAEAAYYFGLTIQHERGPLATWRYLRKLPPFPNASPEQRADLWLLEADVLGTLRDFDSAARRLEDAASIDADRPWLWVARGSLYVKLDAYEEALDATRHALGLHPWYRPAVQSLANQLQLVGRDEEALDFLRDAIGRMECASLACQLAILENELGQHAAALEHWQQMRSMAPWMEPRLLDWWHARMSDAHYFAGNLSAAADAAEKTDNPFHKGMVDRLREPGTDARRVLLDVGFVRQHHFTCAPATLSALSRYWKMPVDHLALAAAICYDGTPDHIERNWAEENGWHAREFRVTWEVLVALLDRGVPFTLTTVETQSAHLQAVIGYDSFRGTILVRDPYARTHGEWLATEFLERYAASGPRGMLLLPPAELHRLEGIALPEADPYDHHYRLQRALHGYDREAAQGHLSALEQAAPDHRLTYLAQRAVAGYDGSGPRQLAAVEALLQAHPKNGTFLYARLNLLRFLGRRTEYQELLRQVCAEKDSEPLFWREWASEQISDARRLVDARRLIERALRHEPMEPDNLQARANIHWEQREFAEATELYRLAANLRDKVDQYSRSYFIAARHLRQTDTALALLERRFAKFGAQSSQPTRLLFWALGMLNREEEAFSKLELALQQRPDDGELLLFAADAFARQGDFDRGAELLRAAEKRTSRVAWLRSSAILADYRCDLQAALRLWSEIVAEEPLAMDAQRSMTRLIGETAGRAAALQHLETTCARFEHHIALHELWAEWARQESNTAVVPVLHRLLALHPEHAWAHRELASVYSSLHRPDEAAASLEIAEQLEPRAPATPGVRAQAALAAGRHAIAREHARAALRLSVDYDYAINLLLAASDTFEEKKASVAFIREELVRQVVFGDGLLAFRTAAYDVSEPAELLAELRAAHRARPDLWHAWAALVQQLLDMGDLEEALRIATEATERFPLLPKLWLDLAQVRRARREREQEIPPLQRALQLSPSWGVASRHLSDTHQRMGRYEEAARVLEQAIAAAPLDPYNHGSLAGVLHHLQQHDAAVAKLEHALKLDPDYDWAWEMLQAWSPEKGAENRALQLARQLTTLRAGEARSWFIFSQTLPQDQLDEKLAALDHAIGLNPRYVDAHDRRAFLLSEARRFEEALAACAPSVFEGHTPYNLRGRAAWVEYRQGRPRAAIARMQAVLADAPDYYWGWNLLADWSMEDRDFVTATEAARRMARLAPRSAIPLGYLADVQLQDGKESDAYHTLRQAFDLDPTYVFAGTSLFERHMKEGEYEEARRVLDIMAVHQPSPRIQTSQIRLHASQDRPQEALAILESMVRIPESESGALQAVARAFTEAGWRNDMAASLSAFLEEPGINSEIGVILAQRWVGIEDWKSCERIFRLDPASPMGQRARLTYIEELAAGRHAFRLWRLIRRERAVLRSNTVLWATVGYAYVHLGKWRSAVRWMRGFSQRTDLRPWMLTNLATALREENRDPEALSVNQRAVALPPDGSTPQHQLWIVFELALAGSGDAAQRDLAEIKEYTLGEYEKKLLVLVNALCALHRTPVPGRKIELRKQREIIGRATRAGAFHESTLFRSRIRALAALSRAAGERWGWLRSRLPVLGGVGAGSDATAWLQRYAGAFAAVFAILATTLVKDCTRDSDRTRSVPPRPSTPRYASPTPAPFQQQQTIILDLPNPAATPPLIISPIEAK